MRLDRGPALSALVHRDRVADTLLESSHPGPRRAIVRAESGGAAGRQVALRVRCRDPSSLHSSAVGSYFDDDKTAGADRTCHAYNVLIAFIRRHFPNVDTK